MHSTKKLDIGWVIYNPWKVIVSTLMFMTFIGYFMQFVAPSISFKDLLGESWPGLKDYNFLQTEYIADDNLLVYIESVEGDAFTPSILTGVKNITDELWKTPYSIRVDSITNFQHTTATGDNLAVGDLIPTPETLNQSTLANIKHIALNDPIALNRVVNTEGNVLAVNVVFHFPMIAGDEKLVSYAYVDELAANFREAYPQTRVYVGGLTALDATVMNLSIKETGLFLMLVLLISIVLLSVLLRAFIPVIASVSVLLFSVIAALSLSGMMGWKLTPFTSTVPMVVLIIAIADCIHFITVFIKRLNAGEDKKLALLNSLRINSKAIIITSVTTAIGFLTFNLSGSDSIAALGNEAAFGIMTACILSLTFLPALLALLPIKAKRTSPSNKAYYEALAAWMHKRRFGIVASSLLIALIFGFNIPKNTFDDSIPTYFAETLPWRQANDFSEQQFGSAYNFTYSLYSSEQSSISDPAYLQKVEEFTQYLRSLPQAAYVKSVTDTFKRLNKSMHGDDPSYYRLPDNREAAAQYLLLYEMSLPYGLDLNDQINIDKSATKVLAAFKSMSVEEVLAMESQINLWLDTHLADTRYISAGAQIMFARLMSQDTKGLTMGAIYGLLIISGLLIFILRSFKIGMLSVLPNLLPILMAFGLWGMLVGQVGFGLAMVSGMSIGIIVDDTVHFLTKYLSARRKQGLNAQQAVAYSFETVGSSIIFTTIVLVCGFLSMVMLSEFRVNTDMGKMTSIILIFAVLFDLIALPAILMIFDKEEYAVASDKGSDNVDTDALALSPNP